ncbi:PAS domain S-box protein [Pseudanabaena sp. FACHB-2040]|uniref:hybrid sensor histidine kinase/response regulator n=1 Tax=Pseudanabaena sp. FACHB-2040 TaxID=2692859 RepID=UPI0018EFC27C|nr:PAS domain S-box protein [Pseudanabaena sp. FACHB-2040]
MTARLLRYIVAALSVALALGTNLLLSPYLEPAPSPPFFAAIMVSAWYGGLGPGLAAIALSTLTINFFLIEPAYSLSIPDLGTLIQLGIFVMAAILINSLNAAQRAAQQRAEASLRALRQSEARFGCLAESNFIGMLAADLSGSVLEANDVFLQMVGYTKEDLCSGRMRWREMTPPEFLEASEKALQELKTTGACTPFEKEYIRKEGSRVPVLHGAVMTGAETFTGFVLDLSERKRSEAVQQAAARRERSLHVEVQAAKNQLETVLGSINDQFLVLDREWRYTYVNDRVVETVGISRENLLGRSIWEVFPETVGSEFYTAVHRAVAEQSIVHLDYLYLPWQRWFENHIYPSETGVSVLVTEITERKQVEAALRQSEARFQLLVSNMPGMVYRYAPCLGRSKSFTYISSGSRELVELEPATILQDANSLLELIHPDDLPSFESSIVSAVEDSLPWQWEGRLTTPSGNLKWIQGRSRAQQTEYGDVWDGLFLDITDRKQAEEALRQSQTTLSAFIACSPIGIAFFDQNLRYVHANEALATTNGLPLSHHFGRTLWEVLPNWAPLLAPVLQRVMQTREPLLNQEIVGVTYPADVVRHSLVNYFPVCLSNGQVLGVGVTSMDITERRHVEEILRQSEERFRDLADNIAQLAWMADETGAIFWYNRRWFEYTGTTFEEMAGWGWQQVHHPDFVEAVTAKFRSCVAAGSTWEDTFPLRGRDGEYRWFLSRAIPIHNEQGQVVRWFGTNTDVTERLQAEQERERLLEREQSARAEAEAANRIKDEFLAVLSHELRSPLNPILGWSRLLQTSQLDTERAKQALVTIERNARLQAELIEDLLDVSRILRGKLNLTVSPVNLTAITKAALETVRLAAEAKAIEIRTGEIGERSLDLANAPSLMVLGDSTRLQQVVWNLLSNAVKFTPVGGRVEVKLALVTGEGLRVEDLEPNELGQGTSGKFAQITVSDTGKGISPNFLPHVFDYFRQGDSATTRKFGGLGLGLAIVRHLVELHGGSVRADSPGEGLGATFTVRLPLMPAQPVPAESPSLSDVSLSLKGVRVLVVDDDTDTREFVAFLLEQSGAEVTTAANAEAALATLAQAQPDILLSDIGMPKTDGYMLLRQVRALPADLGGEVPAIALTAYAGDYNQQQALEAGFQRHMSKPLEPQALIKLIAELVVRS